MVYTDLMGKVSILSRWIICCSFLILNLGNQLYAQTLVCDGQINVSLGEDCDAGSQITPEMILQGTIGSNCDFEILLAGQGHNDSSNAAAGRCYAELFTPGLYTVTITNGVNSCWGEIVAEDKLGPRIECSCSDPANPCELPAICSGIDLSSVIPPVATDCDGIASSNFSDRMTGGDCGESTMLTRIWSFVDNRGNVSRCVQYFEAPPFEFQLNPDGTFVDGPFDNAGLECPEEEVNLPCGAGTSPDEVFEYFYNQFRVLFPPQSDPISEEYLLNNQIFAVRHAYPYLVSLDDMDLLSAVSIINGSACNLFATFNDTPLGICNSDPACTGNTKVVREWQIFDWCSPSTEPFICRQVIVAQDVDAPEIGVTDVNASVDPWGCSATVFFPKPLRLTDDCSPTVALNYIVSTGSGTMDLYGAATGSGTGLQGITMGFDPDRGYFASNVPVGEHEFFYNAWDCCENIASEPVTVTVSDVTPPVAITKQDVVISLIPNPGDPNVPGVTKIFAESIDNGSFDGCGRVKLEIRRENDSCGFVGNTTYNNDGHSFDDEMDTDNGAFVQFCCSDLDEFGIDANGDGINDYAQLQVWLRVWDDGDGDGIFGSPGDNFSEVWSYVRLEDKSRATILCPGDITIDCDGDPFAANMDRAQAINSCGTLEVGSIDITNDLTRCNSGTIERQWFVVGEESVNCIQRVTMLGAEQMDIEVTFPRDTVITCTEILMEEPTIIAGPCDDIAVNVERDTFFFTDGACFKVLNYWTVINWCEYEPNDPLSDGIWSQVQVVRIIDETAPTITCSSEALPVGADCQGPVTLSAVATDDGICSSNRLTWTAQVDLFGDKNIDFNFSSTINPSSPFYIPATRPGEEVTITLPEGVPGSTAQHSVLWRVSDGCGNIATCETFFTVVDNVPPTPYCVNLSSALTAEGTVELWACDFNLGAEDNCTPVNDLRYTFSAIPPEEDPDFSSIDNCSSRTFSCDDLLNPAGSLVSLNVYVYDSNGNSDFCTVFLTLVDNSMVCRDTFGTRAISGDIATEEGRMIEDVEVQIVSNQPLYPSQDMTDETGRYEFANNPISYDYQISNSKNDDYANGVNTIDLIRIQRHILGLQPLDSPYKRIAADINNDQKINSVDLVELRKLVLGIYTELPQNDSWRFVDSEQNMSLDLPWPLNEIRAIFGLDQDETNQDFVGVKIGDVDNSAIPNNGIGKVVLPNDGLALDFEDVSYKEGETVGMTLKSADLANLSGIQFTLFSEGLEVVDVTSNGIEIFEHNFATLSSNRTTFSWNDINSRSEEELFTIHFKAKKDGTLSESVSINSDITPAQAYVGDNLDIIPVTLTGRNNSEQEFVLYQNTPNPFNNATDIAFYLPTTTTATLTVLDVTGKVLYTQSGEYGKGLNNVIIDINQLNVGGVLYYKLETSYQSDTKKMIVLK